MKIYNETMTLYDCQEGFALPLDAKIINCDVHCSLVKFWYSFHSFEEKRTVTFIKCYTGREYHIPSYAKYLNTVYHEPENLYIHVYYF